MLTLENICPYLPYGLKVFTGNKSSLQIKDIWDLVGINPTQKNLNPAYWGERSDYNNVIAIYPITPILRPMNLTNPIIVEGKEIIPIVELAKIAYPMEDFEPSEMHPIAVSGRFNFEYYKGGFTCYNYQTDCTITVPNQLTLFQWLFKHKFDVFGLIEKGLAIDVNTLETNPYE